MMIVLTYYLIQRGETGGPRATSRPKPRVNTAQIFVNFLLVTTSAFLFFVPND
jgi:hypothetical protein